jgi:hypothetical protein
LGKFEARGLANHDGDLLDAAADRFADIGAVALPPTQRLRQRANTRARAGWARK